MSRHRFQRKHSSSETNFQDPLSPDSKPELSAKYYLTLGNRHYNAYLTRLQKKELTLAVEYYRQALELDSTQPDAYVKLAVALMDQGEILVESAIDYCQMALSLDPKHSEANLFMGYFLRQVGQLEAASPYLEQATRHAAFQSAKPYFALGRVLLDQAKTHHSLSWQERVRLKMRGYLNMVTGVVLLPRDQRIMQLFKLAFITDLKIYTTLTLGQGLQILGLKNTAVKLYELASHQMPEEGVFFHALGDLYQGQKQLDAAIYYYTRAQELDPDNLILHKKLGQAYTLSNDSDNATKSLERVVEAGEEDFDSLYRLAQLYTDRQEYMRALYYFKELVRQNPDNPYLHSNMAYLMFKLEDYDGAIQEYQAAVSFGTDPVWTSTVAQTLGTIYYQIRRDVDSAIGMFQMAYQLDSTNLECMVMLADLYMEQGNLEAAASAYRHILQYEPDNAECHSYLGYLLWQMDQNDEAEMAYLKALELDPRNPVALNNLGVIYLDEYQRPERALECFQKALNLREDYTLASFNIGRAYEKIGTTTEAAKAYSHTLSLNVINPELEDIEILERLDQLFEV